MKETDGHGDGDCERDHDGDGDDEWDGDGNGDWDGDARKSLRVLYVIKDSLIKKFVPLVAKVTKIISKCNIYSYIC